MDEERVYTIPLRKVVYSPRNYRARKAMNLIKEFLERHLNVSRSNIKIGKSLNEAIWSNGIKHPPKRVKVSVLREDENFRVEIVGSEAVIPEKGKEKKKEAFGEEENKEANPLEEKEIESGKEEMKEGAKKKEEKPKKEKIKKEKSYVEIGEKEEKPRK
ncbi:MAG: 50S ribosomal protein L31e [Candidatus Aenigmarchaeota archaeon]|nr:50S ribosomal protein L31e [Candidatus Aenigmarchaeota archaeon]